MLTISGLGQTVTVHPTNYPECKECDTFYSSAADTDNWIACRQACEHDYDVKLNLPVPATGNVPTGVTPTTASGLPQDLAPPPGYTPQTPINWWRIGIGVGLGVTALAVFFGIRKRSTRGAGHAA